MATPYSVFDNRFLGKITDDLLLTMSDEGLERTIDMYRNSATVRFKQCDKFGNRDDELRVYEADFTDEEVEIVASYMVLEWIRQRVNSIELLKQGMSTKDYQMYSQANHLNSLMVLKKDTESEANRMVVSYTYSENDLSQLRKV